MGSACLIGLIEDVSPTTGTTIDDLNRAQSQLGTTFPRDYVDFLLASNGAEGRIGSRYIAVWSVEEVVEWNQAVANERLGTELLLFASDRGNIAYAFDGSQGNQVVSVPLIGISRESACPVAANLAALLRSLATES